MPLCPFPLSFTFYLCSQSPQPLSSNARRVPKSRFASNSTYILEDSQLQEEYLDPNLLIDREVKKQLVEGGMDERLATHFAHLYIRDPLIIYAKDVETFNLESTAQFELIQSTVWQTVRFKPPPSMISDVIGWRVEFRPMEVQMTDFENAAFAVFMVLLSQAILHLDLNFYIPIAKVDENMERAHARDAVLHGRFHFRKDPLRGSQAEVSTIESLSGSSILEATVSEETSSYSDPGSLDGSTKYESSSNSSLIDESAVSEDGMKQPPFNGRSQDRIHMVEDEYESMSIHDIVNGQCNATEGFPGLIPLVRRHIDTTDFDDEAKAKVDSYLALIGSRASGKTWTSAKWQREFVRGHPSYETDSVVGERVAYDLLKGVKDITDSNGGAEVGREMFNF